MKNIWFASLLIFGVVTSAAAQQPAAPPPAPATPAPTSSPLIVEKIENGWLIAPDAKWADSTDAMARSSAPMAGT